MPEKIYSSNAERQRAYRQRKKAEHEQHQGADGLSQEDRASLVEVLKKFRKHPLKKDVRDEVDRLMTLLGGTAGRPPGRPAEDMDYRPIEGQFPLL